MTELVLISHGNLCVELKKSAEMIMGPQEHIHAVPLLPAEGQEDFLKKFDDLVKDFDDYVVFSDLLGGTPANTISKQIMLGRDIQLYAGMNLPMVIEFVNASLVGGTPDYVTATKGSIVKINDLLAAQSDEDDEDE